MIVKREKYFIKKVNKIGRKYFGQQKIKRTSFWLLGVIPLYIRNEIIGGDWEN